MFFVRATPKEALWFQYKIAQFFLSATRGEQSVERWVSRNLFSILGVGLLVGFLFHEQSKTLQLV